MESEQKKLRLAVSEFVAENPRKAHDVYLDMCVRKEGEHTTRSQFEAWNELSAMLKYSSDAEFDAAVRFVCEMGRQSWDPELTAEEASALAARLKDFHIAD